MPLARVMALVLIGLGSMSMGWLLWPHADGGVVRAASATVVQSVLCGLSGDLSGGLSGGPAPARDVVRVELADNRELTVRLDGCGHRLGEVLTVELPDPLPEGEPLARIAGTGVSTTMVAGRRLEAIAAALASVAGALLAWRLRAD